MLPVNKSFIYDGTDGSKAQRDKQSHVAATDEDNAIDCNENQILWFLFNFLINQPTQREGEDLRRGSCKYWKYLLGEQVAHFSFCQDYRTDCQNLSCSLDCIFSVHRSKSPLFDELSIPFIDASLPPTPKTGRSQNALEILLGRRSLNSSDASLTGINPLHVYTYYWCFSLKTFNVFLPGIQYLCDSILAASAEKSWVAALLVPWAPPWAPQTGGEMCHKDVRCGIGLVDLALQGADAASVTFRSCQNLLASPHLPHPPPLLSTLDFFGDSKRKKSPSHSPSLTVPHIQTIFPDASSISDLRSRFAPTFM